MNALVRAITGILILSSIVVAYTQKIDEVYLLAIFVGVDYLISIFTGRTLIEVIFGQKQNKNSTRKNARRQNKPRRNDSRNDSRGGRNSRNHRNDGSNESRSDSRNDDDYEDDDYDDDYEEETVAAGATLGTVKWFSIDKGFGFIVLDNGDEVFVHHRGINAKGRRILREGQEVRLDVVEEDKGPQAQNVTVVS